jgi:hypothetical protein
MTEQRHYAPGAFCWVGLAAILYRQTPQARVAGVAPHLCRRASGRGGSVSHRLRVGPTRETGPRLDAQHRTTNERAPP